MLLIRKCRAFTLIEMVLVISIVIIILTLVLPAIDAMWKQTHLKNANLQVSNMLRTAQARSQNLEHFAYGVLFYVDPFTNNEVAAFIEALTYPIADDETWPDVCDRYQVADGRSYPMANVVRISPYDSINWTVDEMLNGDYQTGKQRNFFAIIFARGKRFQFQPFVLYDPDSDDDGLGDITSLPVGETVGKFGGVMRDIVEDADQEKLLIGTDWGFRIYDENVFKDMSPDSIDLVPHLTYYLTRHGRTVFLEG